MRQEKMQDIPVFLNVSDEMRRVQACILQHTLPGDKSKATLELAAEERTLARRSMANPSMLQSMVVALSYSVKRVTNG
jgi:hypothetical protein